MALSEEQQGAIEVQGVSPPGRNSLIVDGHGTTDLTMSFASVLPLHAYYSNISLI